MIMNYDIKPQIGIAYFSKNLNCITFNLKVIPAISYFIFKSQFY